ncbi:MAG: hypothetical protein IJX96_04195 [Clostridia bacterium]|nr:hypothetical protein [Clostridia bacterium]
MKSFKDYASESPKTTEEAATAEELTKKIASAYNGKSNADMLRNILAEAEKSKRAGTLSNEEIENFYQTFSPMLDGIQRKKLRVIVDKLKEI